MVAHGSNPTLGKLMQEDHDFKAYKGLHKEILPQKRKNTFNWIFPFISIKSSIALWFLQLYILLSYVSCIHA